MFYYEDFIYKKFHKNTTYQEGGLWSQVQSVQW